MQVLQRAGLCISKSSGNVQAIIKSGLKQNIQSAINIEFILIIFWEEINEKKVFNGGAFNGVRILNASGRTAYRYGLLPGRKCYMYFMSV